METSPVKVIKPWHKLVEDIDLPLATAVWVLGAHVVTLLSPFVLIAAIAHYWSYLQQVMHNPVWLYVSAVFMMIASAFETADNSFDRWYLTGLPPSQCDFMFSIGICLSMAFTVLACVGQYNLITVLAFLLVLAFAIFYLVDGPKEIPRAILGVGSTFALYWVTNDAVVFLILLATFLTIYFFNILCATLAQAMHGFTTLVNALGVLCIPWAFYNASRGEPMSLMAVITIATVIVAAALMLKPRLLRLKPTPRKF